MVSAVLVVPVVLVVLAAPVGRALSTVYLQGTVVMVVRPVTVVLVAPFMAQVVYSVTVATVATQALVVLAVTVTWAPEELVNMELTAVPVATLVMTLVSVVLAQFRAPMVLFVTVVLVAMVATAVREWTA